MKVFYDKDADFNIIKNKIITIVGLISSKLFKNTLVSSKLEYIWSERLITSTLALNSFCR